MKKRVIKACVENDQSICYLLTQSVNRETENAQRERERERERYGEREREKEREIFYLG